MDNKGKVLLLEVCLLFMMLFLVNGVDNSLMRVTPFRNGAIIGKYVGREGMML